MKSETNRPSPLAGAHHHDAAGGRGAAVLGRAGPGAPLGERKWLPPFLCRLPVRLRQIVDLLALPPPWENAVLVFVTSRPSQHAVTVTGSPRSGTGPADGRSHGACTKCFI